MAEDYKKAFTDRTNKHIERVNKFAKIIGKSYPKHDADKFNELFNGYSLMNKKDVTKEEQAKIDNATYLHVLNNDHHCEHWCDPADIEGFSRENPTPHGCLDCSEMPEYALEEMCCDWCAMSEEFNNTPFEWFEKNKDVRWHFDEPQTEFILNTLHTLWDNKDELEEKIVKVDIKQEILNNLNKLNDLYSDSYIEDLKNEDDFNVYVWGKGVSEFDVDVLVNEKLIRFKSVHIKNNAQNNGIAMKLIDAILSVLEDDWTIEVVANINASFWNHIASKYSHLKWVGLTDVDESIVEKIVKKGNKWQVQSKNGKNLGTYDTKPEAEKRLQQVHYFKHINEALTIEDKEILNDIDSAFGQEDLYMWSTYILPNGHFLNPDNHYDPDNNETAYEHCDFDDYIYTKYGKYQEFFEKYCMKMNVTYPYVSFPKERPTIDQQQAFKKIIERQDLFEMEGKYFFYDYFDEAELDKMGNNLLAIYTPYGQAVYDLDVSSANDILKDVMRAYSSGTFLKEYLREDKEVDYDSYTTYDWGTPPVEGDDIFDTSYLGGYSELASCIPGNKDYQYMIDEKNKKGEIVMMSPEEYYAECARGFHTTPEELKRSRSTPEGYIKALERVITVKKKKFPMPFIDLTSEGSQEGLHRMMAAGNLFGWDHKFPVLVVDWADKERHEREVEEDRIWDLNRKIDRAFSAACRYTYLDKEDFEKQFSEELADEIFGAWNDTRPDPTTIGLEIIFNGPNSLIKYDGVEYKFDESEIKIDTDAPEFEPEDFEDMEDFDDLDDIDLDEKVLKSYLQK